ncbi:MAG: hypothetical protein IJU98_00370 [Synergistaceae bacterium]|nr:hypothetical protein [Synergistaceae bacterium]
MRKINLRKFAIVIVALSLLCCSAAWAKLPTTYKEFKTRYQTEAKTVEGAVKLYFEGVFAFINPDTREEAGKMLRYILHSEVPLERSNHYATFVERMKDPNFNYCFRSYAKGATPENDYKMNPDNFSLSFAGKAQHDAQGVYRVPLSSSGSDSLRFVQVRKGDDGLWFVFNNAATYVQVKEPKAERIRRSHAWDADYDDPEPEPTPTSEPVKPDTPLNAPYNPAPESPTPEPEPAEWD